MLITITSDASWFPNTKEAGFAFWISCDLGRFKKYGKLKNAETSQEAEIQSVLNALHYCSKHPLLKSFTRIVLNVDCMTVKDLAENKYLLNKKRQKRMRDLHKKLKVYTSTGKIDVRHQHAHKKVTDSKSWVNNWADLHAKKGAKLSLNT